MPMVETLVGDLKALALLVEAWNQWQPLLCHLFTNAADPTPDTLAADLVEATFPGYAPAPVRYWSPPLVLAGVAYTAADPILFTRGAGPGGDTIVGYWLEDANDPGSVWLAQRFAESVPLLEPGEPFVFQPYYTLRALPASVP